MIARLTARFRSRAIRLQLIAAVVGVPLLLMVLLLVNVLQRQENFLLERARDQSLLQADLLATSSVQQVLTNDLASLAAILANLGRDRTVRYAMVTDVDGLVLSHTDTSKVRKYLRDPKSLEVLRGPAIHRLVSETGRTIESASPVMAAGQTIAWAWVGGDSSPDREHIARIARSGLIYTGLATVLGAVFALVVARAILNPLRMLLRGARRLALDNLEEPVPIVGGNEVSIVAGAFNDAMRRLREQREELQRARDELETRVRQRTQQLSEANQDLKSEIERRERVQQELTRSQEELERRVADRTAELAAANRTLRTEIAERREVEEALRRKNEDLKTFAYAASHDLQQPLRAMAGYAQLLQRRYEAALDDDARDFIGYIVQGSRRMQDLIRDLLEYSRAVASEDLPPHPVECHTCFAMAVTNLQDVIETSRASIQCDPMPKVMAHEVAILQLFQNLLANAIKYRGEAPPDIHAGAAIRENEAEFFLRDNGIGIDPAHHASIFRLFKRLHDDRAGTGIGLAICARIVHRYGGRIWVESAPGAGSTFRFTLPRATAAE